MSTHAVAQRRTLHAIAIFEAFKGIVVLVASIGLLGVLHHDMRHVALDLIRYLGMHVGGRYPTALLHYADILENANLRSLVLLASGYAIVRLAEAYGLWKDLAWGEWVGALSGTLYIPFEIRHLFHRPSVIGAVILAANVCVVVFLAVQLYRRRRLPIAPAQCKVDRRQQ